MILQTNKIINALHHITDDSLVIFDIDNTLIETIQEFGSYAWMCVMTNKLQEKGWEYQAAIHKTASAFEYIKDIVAFKTVEATTHELITQLCHKNITIMALTFRSFTIRHNTIKQLDFVDIDFSQNTIHETEILFDTHFGFSDGILYSGFQENKGACLVTLLKQINYYPKHVVFIDDGKHHIDEMYEALNTHKIPATCIHYTATAKRAEKFCMDDANSDLLNSLGKERFNSFFKEWI